jgi:Leucine-rich repeat (LRR) protein
MKALALIEEAKANKATFLDLGNLGLTELPDELFELTDLEMLNVGPRYFYQGQWHSSAHHDKPNVIKWIPWRIKRLTNLQYLSLFGIYAGDIHGLQGLPQLTHLDLGFNYQIRDFNALQYLRKLQYLSLNTSEIYNLGIITAYKHLTFLDLSYNRRRTLEHVVKFTHLNTLLLASNFYFVNHQ